MKDAPVAYCSNCGVRAAPGARHCANCGAAILRESNTVRTAVPPPRSGAALAVGAAAVGGVLAVAALARGRTKRG